MAIKTFSAGRMAMVVAFGLLALAMDASAQETTPRKSWVIAGFARPGTDAAESKDSVLGGTIYGAVYQLTNDKDASNDPYGTGMPDFATQFVPGTGSGGLKSPATLTGTGSRPKYLYVFQVVNDRGIDQTTSKDGIRFASKVELHTRDIGALIFKMPVDPRGIVSWGYFKNTGFAMNALDRGTSGQARPASLPPQVHMAVSANPSILHKIRDLNSEGYNKLARAVAFKPNSGFNLEKAGKGLKGALFAEELTGRKEKLVSWEKDALQSMQTGGDVPEAVELLRFTDGAKDKAAAVIRTSFVTDPLKVGEHSVLFGFTSNLPPSLDMVRMQDVARAKKNEGIRTVAVTDPDFDIGTLLPLPKEQEKSVLDFDLDAVFKLPKDRPATAPVAKKTDTVNPANVRKLPQMIVDGMVTPGDIVPNRLVDAGAYKAFGGTVYFAVFRRSAAAGDAGDTWGVGQSGFDSKFVVGESYRASYSPSLDTNAEYLYLYQVVNDRAFHDFNLPANKTAMETPVALADTLADKKITREVASFSLFLRTDPRLITSWGFFEESGFNIHMPKPADDPGVKSVGIMAVSSNLAVLDQLFGEKDKVYRPWARPIDITRRADLSVGSDLTNITENLITPVDARAGGIRFVAAQTLQKVAKAGATRPDHVQVLYFDKASRAATDYSIEGITLGASEVARAVFKAEWLTQPIKQGSHSMIFGFTSNAPPVRSPIRLKDLKQTLEQSSESQEQVFLSPDRIKAIALQATAGAKGTADGITPVSNLLQGDADQVALAIANGEAEGIVPVGLGTLARGSAGLGVGVATQIPSPGEGGPATAGSGGAGILGFPATSSASTGSTGGSGGVGGAMPAGVGAIGHARPAVMGGGGGLGGGSGSGNGNTGTKSGTDSGSKSGSDSGSNSGSDAKNNATVNIDFNVSLVNQQNQSQYQTQEQQQKQNQSQNQSQDQDNGGGGCCDHGNVIPAPPSLLLGLLGLPGLLLFYRRRMKGAANSVESPAEARPASDPR